MACLYIGDDLEQSAATILKLRRLIPLQPVSLSQVDQSRPRLDHLVFIDICLSDIEAIRQIAQLCLTETPDVAKVFIIRGVSPAEPLQANALGATATISSNVSTSDMNVLLKLCGTSAKQRSPNDVPEEIVNTTVKMGALQDSLHHAVASNEPLPKAEVLQTSNQLSENLRNSSVATWLEAVKQHNSYTYRHCMGVSALTVAFALHLGFSDADVQRMSIGAILHDVGKVKIPIEILDKPGALTERERAELVKHPRYGFEILQKDGQFSDEVLDIALHHHELLDGSGYPDGLSGGQIHDVVRMITIVDVFAALIDRRSYRAAMPAAEAYKTLLGMEGKLELALVRAFEPIARILESSPMAVHFRNSRASQTSAYGTMRA